MTTYRRVHELSHTRTMHEIPVSDEQRQRLRDSGSNDQVLRVWASRDHVATLYQDWPSGYPRLTIHSTEADRAGHYRDGITWDTLQRIKRECGLGHAWAVEVFPADDEVVGVRALRHLWIVGEAPPFAWTEERELAARGLPTDNITPKPLVQEAINHD